MSNRPTPETDKAEYEVRLGNHRRKVVRPELARELERQLDQAKEIIAATLKALPVGYIPTHTPESLPSRVADIVSEFAQADRQRDAYADTLRVIAESNDLIHHDTAYSAFIRERHPELAEKAEIGG